MTDAEILDWIRSHPDPVVSTSEVAEGIGMSRRGMGKRLKALRKDGKVSRKRIGRHDAWYVPE
jgi:DNA-binding transcriptional ArsR family regulator